MCGIGGIVTLRSSARAPERAELARMALALRHRGPDELGTYCSERVGLAHSRLSIIDAFTGQQPMSTDDGALWVVFNGEIFNYRELRRELMAKGCVFRTRSDTEVILQAHRTWGEAAFDRMQGQWALALWDARRRALLLCRDRQGIRPLHLMEHAGRVYFASEVKAIFACDPTAPRALDPRGLDHVFTFWGPVAPQSVFRGVRELPPAHLLTIDERGVGPERRYWTPRYRSLDGEHAFTGSRDEAARAVRSALEQATASMMRADVPVGSYVSGGIDSAVVTALAQRAAGGRLRTFSLRFDDPALDEGAYQRLVVRRLETAHEEILVTRRMIACAFPDAIWHTERPILRTAPVPMMLLSRLVQRAGVKVVLTGEGADEMFAGYDLFREGYVRRFWARRPDSELRPLLLRRLYPYLARSPVAQLAIAREFFGRDLARAREPGFAHGPRWRATSALRRLFSRELRGALEGTDVIAEVLARLPHEHVRWPALATDQHVEIETLLVPYILSSQGDRMLMASSVEGRFPFLDEQVVDLASSLPCAYKLRGLDEKHVLKRAAAGLVPREIVTRDKQPYRAPDAACFTAEDRPDWVGDVLASSALRAAGIFDPRAVDRLWAKCSSRDRSTPLSNSDDMALIGVISTQLLHAQLVATAPRTEVR